MSEQNRKEQEPLGWQELFEKLKLILPLVFLIYVGFALYTSWMIGGKGGHIKTDPEVEARMKSLNCTAELKKHVVPSSRKLANPWLLQTRDEGGLYLDALREKPECSGLIMLWGLPSRNQLGSDYITYYYDKSTNRPAIKVTVEYLH